MRENHHHHEIQTPLPSSSSSSSNRKPKSFIPSSKKLNHNNHHHHPKLNQTANQLNLVNLHPVVIHPVVTDGEVVTEKESVERISEVEGAGDVDKELNVDIWKRDVSSDCSGVIEENVAVDVTGEAVGISPVSEVFVSEEDQPSIESYIASLNQHISPSFLTSGSLEATPLSSKSPSELTPTPPASITTFDTTPSSSTSPMTADYAPILGLTIEQTKSVKLESLANQLRESMFQVLHSSDIDPTNKKLLAAMVKIVIQEFCSLHEDNGSIAEWFSSKVKLVVLSYLLVMLIVCAGFFLLSDAKNSYHGPTPT